MFSRFLFCFCFCLCYFFIFVVVLWFTVKNDPEHGSLKQHRFAIVLQPQKSEVQNQTHLPKLMVSVELVPPAGHGLNSEANPNNRHYRRETLNYVLQIGLRSHL